MKRECKVAIVTGAGQGLGAAIAVRLAVDAYHVVIAEYDQALASQSAGQIVGSGNSAVAHKTDVSDEASVKALVEFSLNEYGRIDALVNNAGIYPKSPVI